MTKSSSREMMTSNCRSRLQNARIESLPPIAILFALLAMPATSFSQPIFTTTASLEWMVVDSSLIVRGRIGSIEELETRPSVFLVTLTVTETLKGSVQEKIEFVLPAKSYPVDGVLAAWADKEKELLVFLRDSKSVEKLTGKDYSKFPYAPRSGWRDESVLLLDAQAEVQVMSKRIEPLSDPQEILKRTRAAVEATKTGSYQSKSVNPAVELFGIKLYFFLFLNFILTVLQLDQKHLI